MSAKKMPKKSSTIASSNIVNSNTVSNPNGSTDTNVVNAANTSTSTNTNNSLAFITQCTQHLDAAEKALPPGENLTALEKRRGAKNKKGGELYIPQLIALARQHGVSIPLIPLDLIEQNVSEVQALAPLEKQLGRLHKRVIDRLFNAQSVSWGTSTALYSVLRRLSKNNGDLQAGLAPVEGFFSARHKSVITGKAQARLEKKAAKLAKDAEIAAAKAASAAALAATKAAVAKGTTASAAVVEPAVKPAGEPAATAPATGSSSPVTANGSNGAANGAAHA